MKLRTLFASVVATSLLACVGKVTSLGGVEQPSAIVVDDGGSTDPGAPGSLFLGSADAGSDSEAPRCWWYSWAPIASEVENEYLLPANAPHNNDPGFKPENWDLAWVRVELLPSKRIGIFRPGPEACGEEDGWYFSDGVSGATATRYSLCPATRADVTGPNDFRLSAAVCE